MLLPLPGPSPVTVVAPTYLNNVGIIAQAMPFDFFIIRNQETLLGNALSDALRLYSQCDIMLLNSGAIRAGLTIAGNISVGDVQKVLPLAATLTVLRVRGDVLLQILENSVSRVGASTGTGRFLDPSGLDFGYNLGQAAGRRVTFVNVWANLTTVGTPLPKRPLDLLGWYTIGMSTFDALGGDGFSMLVNNTYAQLLVGQTTPRLDLATRQIWASQGIVRTTITGRIVNDSSVAAPVITLVSPSSGPLNGGAYITVYGENLVFEDDSLKIFVGPTPSTLR